MKHSGDVAVHKRPQKKKKKKKWNALAEPVEKFGIGLFLSFLYIIRYKKKDATLVQCPFNYIPCAGTAYV